MSGVRLLGLVGLLLGGCVAQKQLRYDNSQLLCQPDSEMVPALLAGINRARSEARRCGFSLFAAAQPVRWNLQLQQVAERHAVDMATGIGLSHTGSDGSRVANRVTDSGYRWRLVGENIAGGYQQSAEVIQGWLESSAHCANMMKADFVEIGAACRRSPQADLGTYWALVLATPK